jgi:type II secretory pathway pseudopilin PulG
MRSVTTTFASKKQRLVAYLEVRVHSRAPPRWTPYHTMNPARAFSFHCRGITLVEVLVVLGLVVLLSLLLFPAASRVSLGSHLSGQAASGKTIFVAMQKYAGEGDYPLFRDRSDPTTRVSDTNAAFEILLQEGYLRDKSVLFQGESAWCQKSPPAGDIAPVVCPGQDLFGVAGLDRSSAQPAWPLLANAFAPGTTSYVADQSLKGGSYRGTRAVVIYCAGNAEVVETIPGGDGYYIRRSDKPQADAFVPANDWLTGADVKVLYPKGS